MLFANTAMILLDLGSWILELNNDTLTLMRLTVLYRERSDHARAVTEFVEMLRRRYPGKKAHLLDIDTREGAAEASMYDVVRYPAVIVTTYEGRVSQVWQGLPLPLIDEVGSLLRDEALDRELLGV